MSEWLRDLRFGFRLLSKNKAFALIAVLANVLFRGGVVRMEYLTFGLTFWTHIDCGLTSQVSSLRRRSPVTGVYVVE